MSVVFNHNCISWFFNKPNLPREDNLEGIVRERFYKCLIFLGSDKMKFQAERKGTWRCRCTLRCSLTENGGWSCYLLIRQTVFGDSVRDQKWRPFNILKLPYRARLPWAVSCTHHKPQHICTYIHTRQYAMHISAWNNNAAHVLRRQLASSLCMNDSALYALYLFISLQRSARDANNEGLKKRRIEKNVDKHKHKCIHKP